MESTSPRWLWPVVLGGTGTLGGLVVAYNPGAKAALEGSVVEVATALSVAVRRSVESGALERGIEAFLRRG